MTFSYKRITPYKNSMHWSTDVWNSFLFSFLMTSSIFIFCIAKSMAIGKMPLAMLFYSN